MERRRFLLTTASAVVTAPFAGLAGCGDGSSARALHSYVSMEAPSSDPTRNMSVKALLNDQATGIDVGFDLMLSQQGRPFFVWGTGVAPDGTGGLDTNNFYFSLTRLQASGSIELDGERHAVDGVTWMDHEYGAFGSSARPVAWILQDMQLDNGFSVSNTSLLTGGRLPVLNQRADGYATLQDSTGALFYVPSSVTPIGRT